MTSLGATFSKRSLRWLGIGIPVLGVLIIAVMWLALWLGLEADRARVSSEALVKVQSLTRAFEEYSQRNIQQVDQITKFIAHSFESQRTGLDLPALVHQGALDQPDFVAVYVANHRGDVVATTFVPPLPLNVAEREIFKVHQDNRQPGLFVGKPVQGKVTQTWLIQMSRRLNAADGSFAGVVVVVVNPAYFTNFYDEAQFGKRGMVGVIGKDSILRARRSGERLWYGEPAGRPNLMDHIAQNPSNAEIATSTVDHVTRYLAYRSLDGYPLVVYTGLAQDEVMAPHLATRTRLYTLFSLATLVLALAFAVLYALMARLRASQGRVEVAQAQLSAASNAQLDAFLILRAVRAPDGRIIDFRCDYCNERAAQMMGSSKSQVLAKSRNELLGDSGDPSFFERYCRVVESRVTDIAEKPVLLTSGESRWLHHQIVAVGDGLTLTVRDITVERQQQMELRQAQEAAQGSALRLLAITNNVPALISQFDQDHRCVFANERFRHVYGVAPSSFLGTTPREMRGEAVYAQISEHLDAALRGEERQFEVQATIRGEEHWLAQSLIPNVDASGRSQGYYSISFDVTERKQQEQALRKSQSFLDRTGKLAGVGGWELDLVANTLFWSDETCRIHGEAPGYQPDLARAIEFYAPEARPVMEAAVQQGIGTGMAWDLELPLIRADGQRIWVRAVGSAEYADGQPVRLVGAFQDVSERIAQQQALKEANERITLATDSGGIGIWDRDLQTGALTCDLWIHRLFGDPQCASQDPIALWQQRVHPDDLATTGQAMQKAIDGGKPFDTEFRVVWPDGSVHHLRSAARVSRDSHGRAVRMTGATWDTTELRRLASDLAEERSLLDVTLQSIGDAVITTNAQGHINWLNPAAERLTGWLASEAKGRPLLQVFQIVHEETREPAPDPVKQCLAQGRITKLADHTVLLSRNGGEYGIEDSAAPIRNEQGEVLGAVLVFHDVSEQRRLTGEMSYRATHDALTGLANRLEFDNRMQRLFKRVQDDDSHHALLYIDLDQFKLVNDACGHAVGDQLLQQMAKLLGEAIRTRDTLARLGGDEFAIILEHCSVEQAQGVAQKICDRMDDFRFLHEDRRFRIGTSIGLVPVDKRWAKLSELQQAADASCYAAKEAGRNRVHVWFDTDGAMRGRQSEMQWTTRLEKALDEDGFTLYAQRIEAVCSLATGLHAEVLLRIVQSNGVVISPAAFLPAAERFHLVTRIDRWVLKRVVDWMAALPDLAGVEQLSVNLSGQSVGDRSFHRWALELLGQAGPRTCRALCLEITETAAVTNMADAAVFINEVRAVGVKVALDDFGAGASSFGYLKNLTVDFLKIDGQFVRDMVDDPLDEAAVRCFADVSKVVGVKTVAEFVDKPAVLERLRGMGVDFAQGYLLHQPSPIDELLGGKKPTIANEIS